VQIGEHHLKSVPFDKLDSYDAVVVVTDHSSVDYKSVAAKAKVVVDTRNAMKNVKTDARARIITL
jgi:UDP-N-acetyl-D-glucosamine dehydrogenase